MEEIRRAAKLTSRSSMVKYGKIYENIKEANKDYIKAS